jgi:hypothetical protein
VVIIRTLYSILDYLLLGAYDQHVPTAVLALALTLASGQGVRNGYEEQREGGDLDAH